MAQVNWEAYSSATTVLSGTSEMNSLANATLGGLTGAGSGTLLDNTSALDVLAVAFLDLAAQGSSRSTGAGIELWRFESIDGGSTYPDGIRECGIFVCRFRLDAATTARKQLSEPFNLPPGKHKFAVYNDTGQAFAASAGTVAVRTFAVTVA